MAEDETDDKKQPEGVVEPIPDTPENVARAIMQGPPKKDWRFLRRRRRARDAEGKTDVD